MTGTYRSGAGILLTLESGGKATVEILGEKTSLKYAVDGSDLKLTDQKGVTVTWGIIGDSMVIGPMGAELKNLK